MSLYLLDTSILIDVLNGKEHRKSILENLLQQGHLLACCAINVAEIYAGLRPHEEKHTRFFLESLEYLEITRETACQAGFLKQQYARKGIPLSIADTLIASVAIQNGCTLVTDNIKDYPMKELNLYPLTH
ncbi:MAG: type II toxin-antitoxin system VapC family toxin [Elusimicrobia bacterium]|nr:type II toxin-antitoxin system VapC family toxin [Elusimicrobiota bacterium]